MDLVSKVALQRNWYWCYDGERFHHEVPRPCFLRGADGTSVASYELLIKRGFVSRLLGGAIQV